MKFPRWRWLAVAFLVVFIYQLTALNFDALLAIQHWAVKVAALIAAILALFKYVQEAWRIMTDDFVHTMGRDVSERGLWKRILRSATRKRIAAAMEQLKEWKGP